MQEKRISIANALELRFIALIHRFLDTAKIKVHEGPVCNI